MAKDVTGLVAELATLNKEVDALREQVKNIPHGVIGRIPGDSEGYSMTRAIGYSLGMVTKEEAKLEIAIAEKLKSVYTSWGHTPHDGAKTVYIPFASDFMPTHTKEAEQVRMECKGRMSETARRYDPEFAQRFREKSTPNTTAILEGGALVGATQVGELVEIQRNMEALTAAGVTDMPLAPNGQLRLPKQTGTSTFFWFGENTTLTSSGPDTGNILLSAKKGGVLIDVTNDLFRFAGNPTVDAFLSNDMSLTAALAMDKAGLEGLSGSQPKGITTYTTGDPANRITVHAGLAGANGDTFRVTDIATMVGKLPDVVQDGYSWVMRLDMYAALYNRRADAVSANDGAGQFMFWNDRGSSETRNRPMLYGGKAVQTSQVRNDIVKGTSGATLSYILLGYFRDLIRGRYGIMEILASNTTDTAMTNDRTRIRGIQYVDFAPRQVKSFVLCTDLLVA